MPSFSFRKKASQETSNVSTKDEKPQRSGSGKPRPPSGKVRFSTKPESPDSLNRAISSYQLGCSPVDSDSVDGLSRQGSDNFGYLPQIDASKPFAVTNTQVDGVKPSTAELSTYKRMIMQQYQAMMDSQKPLEPDTYVPAMVPRFKGPKTTIVAVEQTDGGRGGYTQRRATAFKQPAARVDESVEEGHGLTPRRGTMYAQSSIHRPEGAKQEQPFETPVEPPEWFAEDPGYQSGEFEAVRVDILQLKPMGQKAGAPKRGAQGASDNRPKAVKALYEDQGYLSSRVNKTIENRRQYLQQQDYGAVADPETMQADESNDRQLLMAKESIDRNILELTLLKFMTILNEEGGSGQLTALYMVLDGEADGRRFVMENAHEAEKLLWQEFGTRFQMARREEQDRAATQIQAGCRGRLARNHYKRKRKDMTAAATKIQSTFRGHQVRYRLKDERSEWILRMNALIVAEEHHRATIYEEDADERSNLWQQLIIVEQLRLIEAQDAWERQREQVDLRTQLEREEAALRIQTQFRRHSAVQAVEVRRLEILQQLEEMREQDEAAIRIQASYRRHSAMTIARQKRQELQQELDELNAQEDAAIKIQAQFRRHSAVTEVQRRRAALEAQLEQLRQEHEAATKIQAIARRRSAYKTADQKRQERQDREDAAIKIQSMQRRSLARQELQRRKEALEAQLAQLQSENDAAIRIQAMARRRTAVHSANRKRQERDSAIKIQCSYRRHIANNIVRQRRAEEALIIAEAEYAAALRIQSSYRGHMGRMEAHLRRKEEALRIAQEEALRAAEEAAALQIQAMYRGHTGREVARRKREALQAELRELEMREAAALSVQSGWRGYQGRLAAQRRRAEIEAELAERRSEGSEDAEDLDGAERRSLTESELYMLTQDGAVLRIQSQYRGYRARSEVYGMRQERGAIRIQSRYRGYRVRRSQWERQQDMAAVMIQRQYRGHYSRDQVQRMRESMRAADPVEAAAQARRQRRRNIYERAALEEQEEAARSSFYSKCSQQVGTSLWIEELEEVHRDFVRAWEKKDRAWCLGVFSPQIKAIRHLARDYWFRNIDQSAPVIQYLNVQATKIQAAWRGMHTRDVVYHKIMRDMAQEDYEDRMLNEVATFFRNETEGRVLTPTTLTKVVRWYDALPKHVKNTIAMEEIIEQRVPEITEKRKPASVPDPDQDENQAAVAGMLRYQQQLPSPALSQPPSPPPPLSQRPSPLPARSQQPSPLPAHNTVPYQPHGPQNYPSPPMQPRPAGPSAKRMSGAPQPLPMVAAVPPPQYPQQFYTTHQPRPPASQQGLRPTLGATAPPYPQYGMYAAQNLHDLQQYPYTPAPPYASYQPPTASSRAGLNAWSQLATGTEGPVLRQ
uniref:Uncharacterized protein n=1 Tax=Eutreptiella gymnastica TaxID=73025 RepID=A0A7S1NCG6_9EUGL|mmetsp:Transcript_15449/g.27370  ORF Transcript_15449/g.27370 Transcript_15449/m.27370 type:complete len:1366 (+) Transcript_15449:47-4144(+)